ncbi:phage major capsid protein [Myxococcaceae bacterium JPH2]|nr:phage major capsid protein [Myxococcaceae bacterium JPH2]
MSTTTKPKAKSTTDTTPPLALPPQLQRAVEVSATKAVEAAIASRPSAPPNAGPYTSGAKDLQLDLSEPSRQAKLYAHTGLRMKAAYLARAKALGQAQGEHFDKLGKFIERTKALGQFASVFEQGGSFLRETVSTELVELIRPNSILFRAGVRTISNYGAKLTMGVVDEGVQVYWSAEGRPAALSTMKGGALVLNAHKLIARARVSNDLLRLGTIDSSALIGQDMSAAVAQEVDITGIKGTGPSKPNGVRSQMDSGNVVASSGTTAANKITDTDAAMKLVEKANIPGGLEANKAFYYCSTDTFYALRQTRDNAGWVFPELRDATAPKLNGFPVIRGELLAGDKTLGFGLAAQLIFGEAVPLEVATGEDADDFSSDLFTMRGVTQVDWLLRYRQAFGEVTGINY